MCALATVVQTCARPIDEACRRAGRSGPRSASRLFLHIAADEVQRSRLALGQFAAAQQPVFAAVGDPACTRVHLGDRRGQTIGGAACEERGVAWVWISVVAVTLYKIKNTE